MREVTNALDALRSDLAAHPGDAELANGVAAIRSSVDSYAAKFADVVARQHAEGWTEKQGMLAALRTAAQALDDQVRPLADPRLNAAVSMLRRQEDEFLLWLSPQNRDNFETAFVELGNALSAVGVAPDDATRIADRAAAYRRVFLDLASLKLETSIRIAVISRAYSDLAPTFAAVQNATRARYAATRARLDATRSSLDRWAVLATALLLLTMLVVAAGTARTITRLLGGITRAMQTLAAGDTAITVPGGKRRDEIGLMAAALEVCRTQMQHNRQLQDDQDVARERAEVEKRAALIAMAETIEQESAEAVAHVSRLTERMDATAEAMSTIAKRADSGAAEAVAAAGQAVAAAQTVAGASHQLTASVNEITRQAGHSTKAAERAVEAGHELRCSIEALSQHASRIGAVVQMIADIAARTNLLALNASIEAARAGEAGRGFAVVASEVKQLANQTAQATQQIKRQIAEVQTATGSAVQAVTGIEATIDDMHGLAAAIATTVQQQGATTADIAYNVTATAAAAQDASERIAVVAREAEQTGQQAEAVRESSSDLNGAVHELKRSVIRVVRTATAEVNRRVDERIAA